MSLIELKGITKTFHEADIPILKDIDICINKNQITVIYGTSGAGKTTLLNVISGIDNAYQGEYFFNGQLLNTSDDKSIRKHRFDNFSICPQNNIFIDYLTIMENLEIIERSIFKCKKSSNQDLIYELIDKLNINIDLNKNMKKISGGEKRRLSIIRTVLNNNEIIILDEPSASLDTSNIMSVVELVIELKTLGKTIIISTHDEEFKKIADCCYGINDGVLSAI